MLRLVVEKVDVVATGPETIELQLATHPQLPKTFFFDRITAAEMIVRLTAWLHSTRRND